MNRILSFPLAGTGSDGNFSWAASSDSVRDVVWSILLTEPGERLMRPEFGAGLKRYIHQPNNETTRRLIADVALKALQRWEPRIDIIELNVTSSARELNRVSLNIFYRIRATGTQETVQLGLQLQG